MGKTDASTLDKNYDPLSPPTPTPATENLFAAELVKKLPKMSGAEIVESDTDIWKRPIFKKIIEAEIDEKEEVMWQRTRFLIERVNGKKLPFYVILAGIIIFLLVPTGDFTDFITFPIIGILGFKLSIIISLIALIILICNGKVRRLLKSPTRNEVGRICRKITSTKTDYKYCVDNHA